MTSSLQKFQYISPIKCHRFGGVPVHCAEVWCLWVPCIVAPPTLHPSVSCTYWLAPVVPVWYRATPYAHWTRLGSLKPDWTTAQPYIRPHSLSATAERVGITAQLCASTTTSAANVHNCKYSNMPSLSLCLWSGACLVGQIGSRVRVTGVSDSFPKIARLVGQWRSGPSLPCRSDRVTQDLV